MKIAVSKFPGSETTRRIIESQIIGSVIQKVKVLNEQVIAHPKYRPVCRKLPEAETV